MPTADFTSPSIRRTFLMHFSVPQQAVRSQSTVQIGQSVMVFHGIKSGDERKDTSVINRIIGGAAALHFVSNEMGLR